MPNDNLIPLVLAGSVLITVFAFFLIGFLVVHKSRQARARRKLAAYETQLLQTRIEVQEASAKSISAELHDNIGGILSHIKMQLQFLTEAEDGQDLRPELKPLYEDLSNAITDLRGISHSLNGDMIGRIGLSDAMRKEVTAIQRRGKMKATLEIDAAPQLSPEQELLLFRIAQEAIANAVKHSGATLLQVALHHSNGKLRLTIRDNGCGIKDTKQTGDTGMGMMSMAERAKMLGATFHTGEAEGGGTVVSVTLQA